MMREDEGTERMRVVAGYVRTGAMAYLRQQYKVVIIIFVIISLIFAFMSYVLHVQIHGYRLHLLQAVCFLDYVASLA